MVVDDVQMISVFPNRVCCFVVSPCFKMVTEINLTPSKIHFCSERVLYNLEVAIFQQRSEKPNPVKFSLVLISQLGSWGSRNCWELNNGSFFQKIRTSDEAQSKGAAYLIFRLQKRLMVVFFEHFSTSHKQIIINSIFSFHF
jgi:hypothetical protein